MFKISMKKLFVICLMSLSSTIAFAQWEPQCTLNIQSVGTVRIGDEVLNSYFPSGLKIERVQCFGSSGSLVKLSGSFYDWQYIEKLVLKLGNLRIGSAVKIVMVQGSSNQIYNVIRMSESGKVLLSNRQWIHASYLQLATQ
jgi:hypothetical protein